jgi:hypothetical protein
MDSNKLLTGTGYIKGPCRRIGINAEPLLPMELYGGDKKKKGINDFMSHFRII